MGAISRRYTAEDIERGLWTLALHAGRPEAASDALKAQGHHVPKQTLHDWKNKQHPDRYQQILNEASHQIADRIAGQAEAFMLEAGRVELKALEKLEEALDQGDLRPTDISGALRNLTTSKALNNDKVASPLRGRPSAITEHRSVDDIARKLQQLGVIEGTAEEITS